MADGFLGFEGFETDDTASVWEEIQPVFGGSIPGTIHASGARSGGKGLYFDGLGTPRCQSWLWPPKNHVILGFAFRVRSLNTDKYFFELKGPGDVTHISMFLTGQRTLGIEWQGGAIAYTNYALDYNTWYFIEIRVKIHNTLGEIEVRMNGNPTPELTQTNVDTAGGSSAVNWFANQFHVGQFRLSLDTNFSYDFDDFYVRDNEPLYGFAGDVEVIGYGLVGDFVTEWVKNQGTTNYENVIEQTPDEDTTYVETAQVSGIKEDLYEVADSTYQGEILAVQLVSRARKTSTYLWRLRNKMQVSAVDAFGAVHYLGYPNYETFPPDVFGDDPSGAPWTNTTFNLMKVGFDAEPVVNVP